MLQCLDFQWSKIGRMPNGGFSNDKTRTSLDFEIAAILSSSIWKPDNRFFNDFGIQRSSIRIPTVYQAVVDEEKECQLCEAADVDVRHPALGRESQSLKLKKDG